MINASPQLKLLWPNPSFNTEVPHAEAVPAAARRQLVSFR